MVSIHAGLTTDLQTVVSDRIARFFGRSGATRAVVFDIFKAVDRVFHAGRLYELKFYGTANRVFDLFAISLNGKSPRS